MKVIDLLNKIANGEEVPGKIKYNNDIYEYVDGIDYKEENGYFLFDTIIRITKGDLNMEVEIIEDTPKEDKKIDKLYTWFSIDKNDSETMIREEINTNFQNITEKIDEVIDRLNGE